MYRPKGLRVFAPKEKHGMWRVVKIGIGNYLSSHPSEGRGASLKETICQPPWRARSISWERTYQLRFGSLTYPGCPQRGSLANRAQSSLTSQSNA
jgi:hypothetical protein